MMNCIEIKDIKATELNVYARLHESQLLHLYEPDVGLFIAESPIVIERALDAGYEPVSALIEKKQLKEQEMNILRRCENVPVYTAESDILEMITGFKLTRGMLCAMRRKKLQSVDEICNGAKRIAILENIVNPTNIGAIFRSAAALNMDAVILTQACSDPLYRRAIRVSMGTVFQIPWTIFESDKSWPFDAISYLHSQGFKLASMALRDDTVSIDDKKLMSEERLAIVLGTEGEGLNEQTILSCDYTIKIPMSHGVDSLNVAAASAVAFWQLGNKKTQV